MEVSEIIKALHGEYLDYNRKVEEYLLKTRKSFAFFFTGNSAFANDTMHNEFYDTVKALILDLVNQPEQLASNTAAEIINFMLLEDSGKITQQAKLMFMAAEGLVKPLIPYLSPEDKTKIYEAYKRKKGKYLPVQKETLSALK